jgi:hypothetical protein
MPAYNFLGFYNWPPVNGQLTMLQGFDVFRASESSRLPRSMCESCVCWRMAGTCAQVQVEDFEADRQARSNGGYEDVSGCIVDANCCPILFFDFIGRPLPKLVVPDDEDDLCASAPLRETSQPVGAS